MVHKHRNSQKTTFAKDISPMRNMHVNKQQHMLAASNSPSTGGFCFGSRLSVPVAVPAAAAGGADKWKYNNMINNNRDQFNSMHFC